MTIIKFTDTVGIPEEYTPMPASKFIPEWYKNLESYFSGEKKPTGEGITSATAKKCMPIFDSITSGYIIRTHTDLWISQIENKNGTLEQHYQWANFGAITFHPKQQLPEHPDGKGHEVAYPKWNNVWSIETPKGYSTLFLSPLHGDTPIVILPGLVDTDKYTSPVNFPFVLRDPNMTGLIPAGTPIAQLIPIKREKWKMRFGSEKEIIKKNKTDNKIRALFFDSYKIFYRQPKEYK
jgi:hypothetical protein